MWGKLCLGLLVATLSVIADDETTTILNVSKEPEKLPKPVIKYLHFETDIQYRYATTNVTSNVANPASKAQEVTFSLVLPETAFISGFIMTIKNKDYKAYVKEKVEAKKEYDAAVAAGISAAHIQQDVRDSNRFIVSVNVEAESKVIFKLTYEELLSRMLGYYRNVINVNPGQIVKDLVAKVHIKEPVPITYVDVPKFRTKNEIDDASKEGDKIAVIEHNKESNPTEATITWSPNVEEQVAISQDGIKGQLVVEYDVSREKSSQILIDEGYFVHFFTPKESTPALPKHVVFVLDISGSMWGRKMDQLKEAMLKILADLNTKDYFSIVLFSSDVIVWSPQKTEHLFSTPNQFPFQYNDIIKQRNDEYEILAANPDNINKAKEFINKIHSTDSTNIMGGLREGMDLIKKGQKKFKLEFNESNVPQPVIIFLTDGQPNVEVSDPNEIVKIVSNLNTDIKVPIFSLGFGDGADLQFLRRLSLKSDGFARNIYEASDASLQLNNFYKEISSPLMADVHFSYLPGQVQNGTLTKHNFSVLFKGSEVVIAGKLADEGISTNDLSYDFIASKNADNSTNYKSPEHCIVILPHPRPLPPPEAVNRTFGHLEKAWGYLTIKQLLDKDASKKVDSKDKSAEREEALKLALKYSFVTPLTSLVVVKPNETNSSVELEKASSSPSYGQGVALSAFAARPSFGFGASSGASYAHHSGAGGTAFQFQLNRRFMPMMPPPMANPSFLPTTPFVSSDKITPAQEYVTTDSLDVTDQGVTEVTKNETKAVRVPIENVTWLAPYSMKNESFVISVPHHGNFTVGYNETDSSFGDCNVPSEYSGSCRHLQYCTLSTFVNTVDEFEKYFCSIVNGFAGVCCPITA